MNEQTPIRRSLAVSFADKLREREADPKGWEVRKQQWQEENAAAIEASNAWVREHGLPLAKYRQF